MFLFLSACTETSPNNKDNDCPATCGVEIELELPETVADDRLIARTDPEGRVLSVEVTGPDGEHITGGVDTSEIELEFLPGELEEGDEYTVTVAWSCREDSQRLCEEDSWTFEVGPEPEPPDPHIEDLFSQSIPPQDVLWVIDNSCSMADEQSALIEYFPILIGYFTGSGADYHIGVVSTDLDDPQQSGRLREVDGERWIDPETTSPEIVFAQMASLGIYGSSIEKGLGATYIALDDEFIPGLSAPGEYNEGFLRSDAELNVIVVSDENDMTQSSLITRWEFMDWFSSLKPSDNPPLFHTIVTMTGFDAGTSYLEVQEDVGGSAWDIESIDWNETMNALGSQIYQTTFCLSALPDVSSIEVFVLYSDETTLMFEEDEWSYDAGTNCASFLEFLPPIGSEISIRYLPQG